MYTVCTCTQVDALEQWLRTSQTKPSLVYCIPTHHNPTSASLTAQRHHQLVAMAMQYGFVIVYDDPYRFPRIGCHFEHCMRPVPLSTENRSRDSNQHSLSDIPLPWACLTVSFRDPC